MAGRVIYIMSTGRCSTQYLARLLALGQPEAMVVHEGVGPAFKPAQVFRTGGFEDVIAETHQLHRQFETIESRLEAGKTFIDTGWPAYAWGPYFRHRFGSAFQFAHLVRNPFAVAASMSTHTLLADGVDTLSKYGIIRPHLPCVKFPKYQEIYARFSLFERGLYHWLEVNSFLQEQDFERGFLGLYRFEDMYDDTQQSAKRLWEKCGFAPEGYRVLPKFDQYNCRNRVTISPPNKQLVSDVTALALELGYAHSVLSQWSDVSFLMDYYRRPRVHRDPDAPVR